LTTIETGSPAFASVISCTIAHQRQHLAFGGFGVE
jgi:hypothetical protein